MELESVVVAPERLRVDGPTIERLPASARLAFRWILDRGPVALPDLEDAARLPRRTLAFAIARLKEERLVTWHARLDDFRFRYYSVHPQLVEGLPPDATVVRVVSDHGLPSSHFPVLVQDVEARRR